MKRKWGGRSGGDFQNPTNEYYLLSPNNHLFFHLSSHFYPYMVGLLRERVVGEKAVR